MSSFFPFIFSISAIKKTSHVLDSIITYSYFLRFHWFLLAFISIIVIETVVYYIFWKKLIQSLEISIITNICSSLIAVPSSQLMGSMWFYIVISAAKLPEEGFLDILVLFSFFAIIWLVSIFTEFYIGKLLKSPQKNDLKIYTIANSITYASIAIILVSIGVFSSLTNQDPSWDAVDFFDDWLFVSLYSDYITGFLNILMGVTVLLLVGILVILVVQGILYLQKTEFITSLAPPDDN